MKDDDVIESKKSPREEQEKIKAKVINDVAGTN